MSGIHNLFGMTNSVSLATGEVKELNRNDDCLNRKSDEGEEIKNPLEFDSSFFGHLHFSHFSEL